MIDVDVAGALLEPGSFAAGDGFDTPSAAIAAIMGKTTHGGVFITELAGDRQDGAAVIDGDLDTSGSEFDRDGEGESGMNDRVGGQFAGEEDRQDDVEVGATGEVNRVAKKAGTR